jgi:hypothetical protein
MKATTSVLCIHTGGSRLESDLSCHVAQSHDDFGYFQGYGKKESSPDYLFVYFSRFLTCVNNEAIVRPTDYPPTQHSPALFGSLYGLSNATEETEAFQQDIGCTYLFICIYSA